MKKIIPFLLALVAALILGNMGSAFAAEQGMPNQNYMPNPNYQYSNQYQFPNQPYYQPTLTPDQYLWSQVVSPSRYGISLPWGDDGITAFNSLGPENWIVYQEKPLPQQKEPSERYHNQAKGYEGFWRAGEEGTWDARDQWPF